MESLIHVWEFEFFDKEEDEDTTCSYYTYSDNRTVPIRRFEEDEPDINNYTCTLGETITEEEFEQTGLPLDFIIDREEHLELLKEMAEDDKED